MQGCLKGTVKLFAISIGVGSSRWNGLCPKISAYPSLCIRTSTCPTEGHRHDCGRQPVFDDWQNFWPHLPKSWPVCLDLSVRGKYFRNNGKWRKFQSGNKCNKLLTFLRAGDREVSYPLPPSWVVSFGSFRCFFYAFFSSGVYVTQEFQLTFLCWIFVWLGVLFN